MSLLRLALVASVVFGLARSAAALDPYAGIDPWWVILHEPEVVKELGLGEPQRQEFLSLRDRLDLRFWPLRNKSQEEAKAGFEAILAEAKRDLDGILRPAQLERLNQIALWKLGTAALQREDLAGHLRFTPTQRQRIEEILKESSEGIAVLQKELNDGGPQETIQKKYVAIKTDEQKSIIKLLRPEQRKAWQAALGEPFEAKKLGFPEYLAPELVDTGEWINTDPIKLSDQRGKVVVVHFYTFGCINCIRNFPWYREWHERFQNEDVVLLGIHTPETMDERNISRVREKAKADQFDFPVLIDPKEENWNTWGNSMWPSVYLVDKRGYMRSFWPGELKWKGTDGEKIMREQIETLLAE